MQQLLGYIECISHISQIIVLSPWKSMMKLKLRMSTDKPGKGCRTKDWMQVEGMACLIEPVGQDRARCNKDKEWSMPKQCFQGYTFG